ncbi:hypothetical protein LMG3412_04810 [Achromobacter deleyi]|nr:hypothetical protein LMG3412_04810 [Achromobacter deleyi]
MKAAHGLVGNGRPKEAHRRAHAGRFRDDDAADAQLARQPRGMQRRRAAKGDQGVFFGGLAQFRCVHAGGVGHVLGDHVDDGLRGLRAVQAGGHGQVGLDGVARAFGLQADLAHGEAVGRHRTDQGVRIGHRRQFAAIAVGGRAGRRAGAVGADLHHAQVVDARDRAAARAYLDHLDDRDADGQAGALQVAVHAAELEAAAHLRFKVVDVADLGGGAAHVERQRAGRAGLLGNVLRQDRAARGAGFDQAHRFVDPGLQGGDRAAGRHQERLAAQAALACGLVQAAQVARHLRLHIGIGADGGQARIFADFGAHVGRQRHPQLRRVFAQQLADTAFVVGVGVAVQQADGHAFDAGTGQLAGQLDHLGLVQRRQHLALGVDAFGDAVAPGARHQRFGLVQEDVVLREAIFQADLDQVAKAGRRQQRGARALAFDQRIGGQRGAQDQQADLRPGQPCLVQQLFDALQHGGLGRVRRGQQLGGPAAGF